MNDSRALLTANEAAEQLRTTHQVLAEYRKHGKGPVFVKLGRKVLYQQADLDAYVAAGRRTRTGTTEMADA